MPPVERPQKSSSVLRSVEMLLWAIGLFLLGWVGFVWADGVLYQLRAGAHLDAAAGPAAPTSTDPTPGERPARLPGEEGRADREADADAAPPEPGRAADRAADDRAPRPAPRSTAAADPRQPLGRLEVPRLGLSVVVAEGTTSRVLSRAVGHLPGTPLPGTYGNSALAAHRDRHFRPLRNVRTGDEILYTSPTGTTRYRVEWTEVVRPEAVRVLDPTDQPALTLITCHPFDFVGDAPDRFVVRARKVGS